MTKQTWTIDKKIPLSVIITLTVYSIGGILYLASMKTDIIQLISRYESLSTEQETLRQNIGAMQLSQGKQEEKYTSLREQLIDIKAYQVRLEALMLKMMEGKK